MTLGGPSKIFAQGFRTVSLAATLILLAAGCVGLPPLGTGGQTLSAEEAARQTYRVQTGDVLEIVEGGRKDSAVTAPVGEDGTVLYPPVGTLPAAGRSTRELETQIEKLLNAQTSSAEEANGPPPLTAVETLTPAQALNPVYQLQTGDQLDISVWEHPEVSQKTEVREDGTFPFPLLGSVQAAGRTTADLENEIRERLDRDYIVNPQVVVRLINAQFTVLGQKGESGSYPIEGSIDLMTAISKAGDILTLQASPVEILRRQGNKQVVIRANVDRLLNGQDPNIPILPRDTIYVKPSMASEQRITIRLAGAKFTALGEVNSPGSYPIETTMDLLSAVSLAGGISKFGSQEVEIIRSVQGRKVLIRSNLDRILKGEDPNPAVLPHDTLYVRRRLF